MSTVEQFQTWHAEIEAELIEARQAAADAETALAEAQTARDAIAAARENTRRAVAPLGRSIARALHARLGRGDDELRQAENAVARARGAAENAKATIADLENALMQTAKLVAPEPAEEPADAVAP